MKTCSPSFLPSGPTCPMPKYRTCAADRTWLMWSVRVERVHLLARAARRGDLTDDLLEEAALQGGEQPEGPLGACPLVRWLAPVPAWPRRRWSRRRPLPLPAAPPLALPLPLPLPLPGAASPCGNHA